MVSEKIREKFKEVYGCVEDRTIGEGYFLSQSSETAESKPKIYSTDYYEFDNGFCVENCMGKDSRGKTLWCIFVIQKKDGEYIGRNNLHQLFNTIQEANEYIEKLKNAEENAPDDYFDDEELDGDEE